MKVTRIKNNITVVFSDGTLLTSPTCTDEMYDDIMSNLHSEDLVREILMPKYAEKKADIDNRVDMLENYNRSEYLTAENNSFYVKSISELSVPGDLAIAIWNAEQADDLELLSTYLNFWTLCCLNPDPEARKNLFWFLNRYGMTISRSGLFVAYRNVVLKEAGKEVHTKWTKFITDSFTKVRHRLKKNPKNYYVGTDKDGEMICTASEKKVVEQKGMLADLYNDLSNEETAPVYTDGYTKRFTIRIGQPVTMDRRKCDPNHNNTCSRGLHVAGKSWLQSNYFGDTGLRVLVSPTDVVAVPPKDSYGKMRCCAYYPVAVVSFDNEGKIVDEDIDDGFQDNFMDMISYVGEISNKEDENVYVLEVPGIPELSKSRIADRLEDIKASLKIKNLE